jgi:signal transducing adaptor molecule
MSRLKRQQRESQRTRSVAAGREEHANYADNRFDRSPFQATKRAREEEAELQRVLELSKQDQGGRNSRPAQTAGPSGSGSGSGGGGAGPSASQTNGYGEVPSAIPYHHAPSGPAGNTAPQPSLFPAREPTPPPMPTRATASRVRAIYPFVTHEKGELSFDKGDVIKVIDRMYDEWYTGAVGGRIGIFPVSYVVGRIHR